MKKGDILVVKRSAAVRLPNGRISRLRKGMLAEVGAPEVTAAPQLFEEPRITFRAEVRAAA